jgi:hypothetical protein
MVEAEPNKYFLWKNKNIIALMSTRPTLPTPVVLPQPTIPF